MVAPGGYASTCPVAGQYAACCCILPGNCYNQWGYFSVWILANTPPSCQAVSVAVDQLLQSTRISPPSVGILLPDPFWDDPLHGPVHMPPGASLRRVVTAAAVSPVVIAPAGLLLPSTEHDVPEYTLQRWLLGRRRADGAILLGAVQRRVFLVSLSLRNFLARCISHRASLARCCCAVPLARRRAPRRFVGGSAFTVPRGLPRPSPSARAPTSIPRPAPPHLRRRRRASRRARPTGRAPVDSS